MKSSHTLKEFQISVDQLRTLKNRKKTNQALSEGKSLQELLGFSEQIMEKFYLAARDIFTQERWKDATAAFTFLTTLSPLQHNYWLGLAMSQQEQRLYSDAIIHYAMAILTKPENPVSHYYMAKCYFALDDHNSCELSLNLAADYARDQSQHAEIDLEIREAQRFLKNMTQK